MAFCGSPLNPQTHTTTFSFGYRSRICWHMARAGPNAYGGTAEMHTTSLYPASINANQSLGEVPAMVKDRVAKPFLSSICASMAAVISSARSCAARQSTRASIDPGTTAGAEPGSEELSD